MTETKIPKLVYNAMFKAVFTNNKKVLARMIKAILDYCDINIEVNDNTLIAKNNELPLDNYKDRQLICDYIVKLNDYTELNIEINKSHYPGLESRNLTYSFKIYYEHFKAGDKYKDFDKYTLLQVNFNGYPNSNDKNINQFLLIDIDDITNTLSKNLCIVNIDIASCYKLVYNNTKLTEISDLERFAGIMNCNSIEDISKILGGDLLTMEEKEKFLKSVEEIGKDKEINEAIKFEDSLDYRFDLVAEDAFEKGITKATTSIIKNMLKKNIDLKTISQLTEKSIEEIQEISNQLEEE